ncbi:MAG: DUF3549 family protein [Candidatus Polarisedimenticolaceae bacterium]|nr:DUF3549 family protein [Candidatus Polarisedimenticolaceae bacterium]
MSKMPTISQFLESNSSRLRLFDMGRRVVKIPREQFLKFEQGEISYPYPLQRKAWFGILFQQQGGEPFIWFLQLPLDELGRLVLAARDDFLHRLLEQISENLQAAKEGQQLESALQDNPYCFKPKEERLAIFHAKAAHAFKRQPSKYYPHAQQYFSGELGWDQWPFVGYQGIADMAVRQFEKENSRHLSRAIPQLPTRPFEALCHCLENEQVTLDITQALLDRVQKAVAETAPDPAIISSAIRGVAQSCSAGLRRELLHAVLNRPDLCTPDILMAISGRVWESLKEAQSGRLYLERLAESSAGQPFFSQSLADLLYLPGMREPLLKLIRSPDRSEQLAQAIGEMFG